MTISTEVSPIRAAYDALAPDYDAFTSEYDYDGWFGAVHAQAKSLGLSGSTALDLACGTGRSTECLVDAGYRVAGCDISPRMVELARRRLPAYAEHFFVADIRELPDVDEVDLVLCMDDAINYLLDSDELVQTFRGVRRALRPGGFLVFDLNTLATFRKAFAETFVRESPAWFFAWRGRADGHARSGGLAWAEIEAFARNPDGTWTRTTTRHEQRHHPVDTVTHALGAAGLECLRVAGQQRGGELEPDVDDSVHIKAVFYARRV